MEERKTSLLQEKIENLRLSLKSSHPEKSSEKVGIILVVLSDLLGGLLVGVALAYLFCHFLGFHLIFGALFIFLGGIAGFFNIYKSMKKIEKKRNKQ